MILKGKCALSVRYTTTRSE